MTVDCNDSLMCESTNPKSKETTRCTGEKYVSLMLGCDVIKRKLQLCVTFISGT